MVGVLHLKQAFNNVNHNILLRKLYTYVICGNMYTLYTTIVYVVFAVIVLNLITIYKLALL